MTTPTTSTTTTTTTTSRTSTVAKVTICHRTKSKKKPYVRIRVSRSALPAHLKHGDVLPGSGPCPARVVRTDGKGHVLGVKKTRKAPRGARISFAG